MSYCPGPWRHEKRWTSQARKTDGALRRVGKLSRRGKAPHSAPLPPLPRERGQLPGRHHDRPGRGQPERL